ncbi:MAG: hypothetical protein L7F77_00590 [Candidatus Magnetominusculus sp. LBB02]|nr:hypothetical protein [Candidatus Magnetominusculus sp. LBB02]
MTTELATQDKAGLIETYPSYPISQARPMLAAQEKAGLIETVTVLFKYKWEITGIFLVIFLLVTIGSLLWPRSYETSSDVLIQFGREYVDRPNLANSPTMSRMETIPLSTVEIVNSEMSIMQSYDIAEKVVSTIGVEKMYPKLAGAAGPSFLERIGVREKVPVLQKATLKFQEDLKIAVKLQKNVRSNVIEVKYMGKNPEIVAQAVNLYVRLFTEKHREVNSGSRSAFLTNQLATFKQKMDIAADKLQSFKEEKSAFDIPAQRTLNLGTIEKVEQDLRIAQSTIASLRDRITSRKEQLKKIKRDKSLYTPTSMDSVLSNAHTQLLTLQSKELNLLQKYKENSHFVKDVRKEILIVRDFIKEQERDIAAKVKTSNPIYQGIMTDILKAESDLQTELAREKAIRQQLQQAQKDVQEINTSEMKLRELTRNFEMDEANYKSYRAKYDEALISKEMEKQAMSNVSIVQEAPVNHKPKWPKKFLNIALAMVFGAACGIGYAFFVESYSQGISSPENVQRRLGLPVIAAISYQQK